MRHSIVGSLVLAGALASGAAAQVSRDGYGRGYDRDARYDRGSRRGADPVSRTLSDLHNARSYGYVDGHERHHFEKAEHELYKFQDRLSRGRFDRGPLDSAIDNLRHLARADQVRPRDRDVLARDIDELRAFRNSGGGRYYDRCYNGYYGR